MNTKTAEAESLRVFAEKYYEWMAVTNYSATTIDGKRDALTWFFTWCEERDVVNLADVTPHLLERYQRHLYTMKSAATGRALSVTTQSSRLATVRAFFKWLTRKRFLAYNPASEIDLPRLPHKLPRHVLTIAETEKVLAGIDVGTATGLRDRAMFEVFYSTGIRRLELTRLQTRDIDEGRGLLMVRLGKGKRDRVVPIGERAMAWVRRYVDEVRPRFVAPPDTMFLFLTNRGRPFNPQQLTQMARRYVTAAEIEKSGACHLFRHTMATQMLENEADIRFIQQMLGHKQLNTTDIYTHVSVRKLKEVHTAKHPGANLRRRRKPKRP